MGELAINPKFNVHKTYNKVIYVNSFLLTPQVVAPVENTFIGGVAAQIYNATLLASKLAIDVSRITAFSIVGSDVKGRITGSYAIPTTAFSTFHGNANNLSFYKDVEGLVNAIDGSAFLGQTNVIEYSFKNVLSVLLTNAFYDNGAASFYLPNCISYGNSVSVNNGSFTNIPLGSKIYAHPSMATNNSGGVEADLAAAISTRSAVVRYVTSFSAPNPITDLAIGTIYSTAVQLNFTPPTGTNAIDYYECWSNGVRKNNIIAPGQYIGGLTVNSVQNITIYAVDIFFNKSVVSNSPTAVFTTNNSNDISNGLYYYYKLDETSGVIVLDSFRGKNLTNTGIVVNQSGKIGKGYLANALGNKIQTTTATPIKNNFSINIWCCRTATCTDHSGILDVGNYGTDNGFGLWINSAHNVGWRINRYYNNYSALMNLSLNTWKMVTVVYNGVNVKMYMDSVLQVTTPMTVNPNETNVLGMFFNSNNNGEFFGKLDEVSIYNLAITQSQIDFVYNGGAGITL